MQRLARCTLVLSLLALLVTWSAPRAAAQTGTVRCESPGKAVVQCPIAPNARVALLRTLSQEACRQRHNWDVAANFIWVSGGCRAEFTVTGAGYGQGQDKDKGKDKDKDNDKDQDHGLGNASANPNQLRGCRTEADRRMPAYTYDQVTVEPESREGSVAYVRWYAGRSSGLCAVHANGRVLEFTTDAAGAGGWNAGGATTRVVCESQRDERQECRIPSGARVRLLRQTGRNPCRLNDTYGQSANYIWVAEGCRGEFEVAAPAGGSGPASRVACASTANSRRQCPIPPGAQVRLARQVSSAPCRTGQTWGVGPDYIWVTRGCSAEFEVARKVDGGWQGDNAAGAGNTGGGGGAGGTGPNRIVCESRAAGQQQCRAPGATSVRLIKQYSTNPCRLDESFGMGVGYVWVSNGCRGEFEVMTGGAGPGGPGGVTGTGLPDRVLCESRGAERTECRIPVGKQVRLARQLGTAACEQNSTWGYGYGMIWVTKGCRGEFELR